MNRPAYLAAISIMTRQSISRNAKCPCGSGKKYKQCCLHKAYAYEEDGGIRRSVPISERVVDELQQHLGALSDERGRELGPDDLLFPNQQLEHAEHQIAEGMKAAGVDPALVYAFEQTGILVGKDNQHLLSEKNLREWQEAIDRYRAQHAEPNVQDSAEGLNEEEMTAEEYKLALEMIQALDPAARSQMLDLAQQSDDADDFVNMIMVGPCPHCASESTIHCEDDPEIEDPSIGRCKDCGQIWCCFCDQFFGSAEDAASHDCPVFEAMEDEFGEP